MEIITIIEDNEWINYDINELKKVAEIYFDQNFKQKTVFIHSLSCEIIIAKKGFDHTLKCNDWNYDNLIIFKKLDEVIKNSIFIDIGYPTENDKKKGTILFYNLFSNVCVNGKNFKIKITIREHLEQGTKERKLKFYYDHYKMK